MRPGSKFATNTTEVALTALEEELPRHAEGRRTEPCFCIVNGSGGGGCGLAILLLREAYLIT
jgi:hypothetical protein